MSKALEKIACSFPATLAEALALLADERTRGVPLAGGTDLMVQWSSGALPLPERAMHIFDLPELKGVREEGDDVVIGGAATHMNIRRSPVARQFFPGLVQAVSTIGGYQMQCRGTLAGNLVNASPAGDSIPGLLAADARVVVAGAGGERDVPMTEFLLGYRKVDLQPGELLVRVVAPKLPDGAREGFRKLGAREAQAISKVMGAYRGHVHEGRVTSFAVSLGSIAPTAVRLPKLEEWIVGRELNEATLAEAERMAVAGLAPISDIRSTGDYRRWVSGRLVRGFLEELA